MPCPWAREGQRKLEPILPTRLWLRYAFVRWNSVHMRTAQMHRLGGATQVETCCPRTWILDRTFGCSSPYSMTTMVLADQDWPGSLTRAKMCSALKLVDAASSSNDLYDICNGF